MSQISFKEQLDFGRSSTYLFSSFFFKFMFKEMQDSLLMAGWSWISDHCRKVTYSDMRKPMSLCADGSYKQAHVLLVFPDQKTMVWTDSRSKNPGWTFWRHIQQSCWGPMLPSKGYLCFLFLFSFKTGCHSEVQVRLELRTILLPQPPKWWNWN